MLPHRRCEYRPWEEFPGCPDLPNRWPLLLPPSGAHVKPEEASNGYPDSPRNPPRIR